MITNPDTPSTHSFDRLGRLLATVAISALALTACSSNEAPSAAAFEDKVTETTTTVIEDNAESASEAPETVSSKPTAVVATTNPPPPTTAVEPTPTTAAPPVIKTAADYENSLPVMLTQVSVQTEVGDPLNVRTGAGVGNEIVTALEHGTGDLTVTDYVLLESGAQWNYISQNGAPIGWVNAAYLTSPSPTAHCVAGSDFPTFEGAASTNTADVDLDGSTDEVFVLAEPKQEGGYNAWVLVSFGNGGVATGEFTGWFDPIPTTAVYVTNLTASEGATPMNEIVLQLGSGASHAQYGAMVVDNCSLVTTTLAGDAFAFTNGASAGHSTVTGCAYGTHGKVEFVRTSMNFNSNEWSTETFELDGAQWTSVETFDHTDFPNISAADKAQSAPALFSCAGLS